MIKIILKSFQIIRVCLFGYCLFSNLSCISDSSSSLEKREPRVNKNGTGISKFHRDQVQAFVDSSDKFTRNNAKKNRR